ncbi:MAG: hypothetical protein ACREVG_09010 [Burkholderiales bacterium]
MLVGGQALAFWLAWFEIDISDGPRVYVSRDADFLGMREHVEAFARAIHGTAVYAPKRGFTALLGAVRRSATSRETGVDVLHKIVGLDADAVRRRAVELTHPRDPTLRFLVMDPFDCLFSRIENLRRLAEKRNEVGIWQARKAIEVCRAYIQGLIRDDSERKAIKVATALFRLAGSAAGLQAYARFGLDILEGGPLEDLSSETFVRQQARRSVAAIATLRTSGG